MAVTISNLDFSVAGDKRRTMGNVTFDSSYPTGGEALSPNQIGLADILWMDVENPVNGTPAARLCTYDHTNDRFLVFTSSDGNEVANGTNLSAFSARFEAVGW